LDWILSGDVRVAQPWPKGVAGKLCCGGARMAAMAPLCGKRLGADDGEAWRQAIAMLAGLKVRNRAAKPRCPGGPTGPLGTPSRTP
jgi:hypothetical protein